MNNNTNNDNNDKFKHVLSKRYTRTRYNYEFADLTEQLLKCLSKTEMDDDACTGPSYPMGPLGPGPGPPSLRGPQTAHALFFHLVK